MNLNEKQLQALKLVNHGNGAGLTHWAQALISRQAKALLSAGLIAYAPELKNVGYKVTKAGYAALEASGPYTRYVDYMGGKS